MSGSAVRSGSDVSSGRGTNGGSNTGGDRNSSGGRIIAIALYVQFDVASEVARQRERADHKNL